MVELSVRGGAVGSLAGIGAGAHRGGGGAAALIGPV